MRNKLNPVPPRLPLARRRAAERRNRAVAPQSPAEEPEPPDAEPPGPTAPEVKKRVLGTRDAKNVQSKKVCIYIDIKSSEADADKSTAKPK
jgi:hypothetical protein